MFTFAQGMGIKHKTCRKKKKSAMEKARNVNMVVGLAPREEELYSVFFSVEYNCLIYISNKFYY